MPRISGKFWKVEQHREKMKSMCNDDHNSNSNNNNNNNNNWLGFSLSPQMKMGLVPHDPQHHHHTQTRSSSSPSSSAAISGVSCAVPSNFFNSSSNHLNYGICYGVDGDQNLGLYSHQLPVMPLKSDGSLCIMEALGRSQQPQG